MIGVFMATQDKSLNEFLQAYDERKKKASGRAQIEQQLVERKRKALAPIRSFMQKFVDLGLVVSDSRAGTQGVELSSTKPFVFYEKESSPTWAPGMALFFDHPTEVEIAIPNEGDRERLGAIVIRSVSSHKDDAILHQKFTTLDMGKAALAKFLGKNAVSIQNDPRKKIPLQKAEAKGVEFQEEPQLELPLDEAK